MIVHTDSSLKRQSQTGPERAPFHRYFRDRKFLENYNAYGTHQQMAHNINHLTLGNELMSLHQPVSPMLFRYTQADSDHNLVSRLCLAVDVLEVAALIESLASIIGSPVRNHLISLKQQRPLFGAHQEELVLLSVSDALLGYAKPLTPIGVTGQRRTPTL
ncbi:hypothetical protein BJX64DRAFT_101997 [Aspergillus heterothallicus]